jgi:mRNA-degrading endonuclease RelE of RelBE toxin-antitoxin system
MRKVIYSPQTANDLFLLRSTKDERQSIKEQARLLAANPHLGFQILFEDPFLDDDRKLYRYDVGRFKLNYTFDQQQLEIVSVIQ